MKWGCSSVGLALALAATAAWTVSAMSPTHAYRLTVEVATPDGLRRASVIRHVFVPCPTFLDEWYGKYPPNNLRGQAVFLDLGHGRNLTAILAGGPTGDAVDQANYLAYYAMEEEGLINKKLAPSAPRLRQCDFTLQEGAAELSPRFFPTFVSFDDLGNPASARIVEPADFGSIFGPGYQLGRITLEMTHTGLWPFNALGLWGTKPTTGIEKHFRWMGDPGVIDNPGWMKLPQVARNAIEGLRRPYR